MHKSVLSVFAVSILATLLPALAQAPDGRQARVAPRRADAAGTRTRTATWAFAAMGTGIGQTGIETGTNEGKAEMYMGGSTAYYGGDEYWYALQYDEASASYRQVFVSENFPAGIRRLKVGNVAGAPGPEIVLYLGDGGVRVYDQASKALVGSFETLAVDDKSYAMDLADLDGDGVAEIALATDATNTLYVYRGDGTLEWSAPGVGGHDLVIGQMDGDGALEIAVSSGQVLDTASRTVQWTWGAPVYGGHLEAGDVDADGMDELIVANAWYSVSAYDVDGHAAKWTIPMSQEIGAIRIADLDHDGALELVLGEGQWGSIYAYDGSTAQVKWSRYNPEHGVTAIAVADVDGDGQEEVIWGAGADSSGPDRLFVVDPATGAIEWENVHLDGPFLGPEIGDLDGDGVDEIVTSSTLSDSTYSSGRLVVLDGVTHRLRAISPPVASDFSWMGTQDIRLADVDGDSDLEILVACDNSTIGVIEIYDFHADNTFELIWHKDGWPLPTFRSVAFRDVDHDGIPEVIGAAGSTVVAYDLASQAEKLRSPQLSQTWNNIDALAFDDFDGDGQEELAAMVEDENVYVLDASTLQLEDTIVGTFRSMRKSPTSHGIQLGDGDGALSAYRWDGYGYGLLGTSDYTDAAIDGFDRFKSNLYAIGSDGVLKLVRGRKAIWESRSYGATMGARTARTFSGELITTSSYGVVGFEE